MLLNGLDWAVIIAFFVVLALIPALATLSAMVIFTMIWAVGKVLFQ